MQDSVVLVSSKKWLWLPLAIYLPVCFLVPFCFFSTWRGWALEVTGMLFVGGGYLLRALARNIYRKLKIILPEHEKQIQAYRDELSIFQWNIMIRPDFVEPLAEGYPRKAELMDELRFAYKISRIWNTGRLIISAALICDLIILFAR